ncbi:hypothetical protein K504DRAFT_465682, partial [Pleomassaria siparia CBS 279.74]
MIQRDEYAKRYVAAVPCYYKGYNRDKTFVSSFRRTTKKHLGYSLGPAFLRHLLTAFARRNGGGKGQGLHVLSPDEVLNFLQLVFWLRFTTPKAYLKTSVIEADDAATQEETGLSYLHLRFRGLQQAVVQDIVNIEPVVAYIAGTGIALWINITNQCAGLSITYSQFGQDDFNKTCTILLASLEDLSKPDLIKLIYYKYQPSLLKMRDVAQYRIPITLLSATMPANEDQQEARGNLRYEVKELSAPFSIPLLTSYVRREEGKELSTLLGCSCYYRGLPKAERTRAVLVATVAFVAGVDIPDIGCILWRGIPSFLGKLEDRNAQWVMQQILNCNYCLRIPINLYLNRDSKQTAAYDGLLVDWACTASLRKRDCPLSLVSSSLLARRDEVSRAAAKAARVDWAL